MPFDIGELFSAHDIVSPFELETGRRHFSDPFTASNSFWLEII